MEDTFHLGIKGLIRDAVGKILLLKVNPAVLKKATEPYWDLPGGRIQRGDSVEATLQREIAEEIGVEQITNVKPVGMVLSKIRIPVGDSDVGLILGVFSCEIAATAEIKISEEHLEYAWFTPAETANLLTVKYPAEFTQLVAQLGS
jgi:8-oxo-dGTP diphosphatase